MKLMTIIQSQNVKTKIAGEVLHVLHAKSLMVGGKNNQTETKQSVFHFLHKTIDNNSESKCENKDSARSFTRKQTLVNCARSPS